MLSSSPSTSDHHTPSEQTTRSPNENLTFSISRLLSKSYGRKDHDHHSKQDKESSDGDGDGPNGKSEHHITASGLHYTAGALYSYPIYPAGHVLRVPPQRGPCNPLTWSLPPLHPAALAHQAVKDRLAGKQTLYH